MLNGFNQSGKQHKKHSHRQRIIIYIKKISIKNSINDIENDALDDEVQNKEYDNDKFEPIENIEPIEQIGTRNIFDSNEEIKDLSNAKSIEKSKHRSSLIKIKKRVTISEDNENEDLVKRNKKKQSNKSEKTEVLNRVKQQIGGRGSNVNDDSNSLNNDNNQEVVNDNNGIITEIIPSPSKIKIFFYYLIEYLICIILILSSMFNFSFINVVYTLIGQYFTITIFNKKEVTLKIKKFLIHLVTLVNSLSILFKLVILIIIKINPNIGFVKENKNLLLDLGLLYLDTELNTFNRYFNCFSGDGMITIGVVMFYFTYNIKMEIDNDDKTKLYKIVYKIFYFLSVITMSLSMCYFQSFLSFLFALTTFIGMIVWSFNKSHMFYRILSIPLIIVINMHILLCHFLNIYDLYLDVLMDNHILRYIGISESYTNDVRIDFLILVYSIIHFKYFNYFLSHNLNQIQTQVSNKQATPTFNLEWTETINRC